MNVQYKGHLPLSQWAKKNGHNWLIQKALDWLRKYAPEFIPPNLDERLIHYGVAFADSPWFGQPESFDSNSPRGKPLPSIRDDLENVNASRKCIGLIGRSCVTVRYVKNPNLYLALRWSANHPFGSIVNENFAADNLAHYAHREPLRLDGTEGRTDVLASGEKGRWGVNAMHYGATLYELARRFSIGLDPAPDLRQLKNMKTGTIQVIHYTTTSHAKTGVPDTNLGSNPFIRTKDGVATWPIWVLEPGDYSPEKLAKQKPGRSVRAATIYLGWALHMMHDLAVPFHARDQAGKIHQKVEGELDTWIGEGKFDHLPVVKDTQFGERTSYRWVDESPFRSNFYEEFRRQDFCRKYSSTPIYGGEYLVEQGELIKRFKKMAEVSYDFYDAVHPSKRSSKEASIAAWEYLLDCALKHTIMMIACLNRKAGFVGSIKGKDGKGIKKAEVCVRSKDGTVDKKVSTDDNGNFAIALPKLVDYEITVNSPGLPSQTNRWYKLERGGFEKVDIVIGGSTAANSISGTVHRYIGTSSRSPLENVKIEVFDSGGKLTKSANTNNSGRYKIELEATGLYTVKATWMSTQQTRVNVRGSRTLDWGFNVPDPRNGGSGGTGGTGTQQPK